MIREKTKQNFQVYQIYSNGEHWEKLDGEYVREYASEHAGADHEY